MATSIPSTMSKRASTSSCGDRLLVAAIDEFGEKGLDGGSTRSIAAAAGTTMSSITYHYGGKEGMYVAAARHIAERCEQVLGESLNGRPNAAELTSEETLDEVDRLLTALLRLVLSDEGASWTGFISREQLNPTKAFDVLYDMILKRVADRLIDLIANLGRGQWTNIDVRMKAVTVLGQIRMFRTAPWTVQRITGLNPADPNDIATIESLSRDGWRAALFR